jgi:tetratricopeptide (TPR) repeat protein
MRLSSRALFAALVITLAPTTVVAQRGKPPKTTPKPPVPPPAPPLTPDQERAVKLFVEGRELLVKKQYDDACKAFTESQMLDPAVGTQLNLALCYEEWGRTATAYRAYVDAEKLAIERKDDRAAAARQRIASVAVRVPHLHVVIPAAVPADATFTVDNAPTERGQLVDDLLLDPGDHTIVVSITGREPAGTDVVLAEGERKEITLKVPAPTVTTQVVTVTRRNKAKAFGGMALVVGGVAGISFGGLLALNAQSDYESVGDRCSDGVCTDQEATDITNDARSKANKMTFVVAGGAVLLGVGLVLMLTSKETVEETVEVQGVSITPMITPELVGVSFGGTL